MIQSRIELLETEPGKKTLFCSGETTLPEQISLTGSLWYEGQERREAISHNIIKKGKFVFQYGPLLKPLPAGKYVWKIQSRAGRAYSCLPHEKVYYHGSLLQKQKEVRDQLLFWEKLLEELKAYPDSLKKQKEALLKEKQKIENQSIQKALQQFYIDFRKLESRIKEKQEEYAFPRFENAFWKVSSLLQYMARYRDMIALQILVEFKLPLQKSFSEIFQKFPDTKLQNQEIRYYEEVLAKEFVVLANSLPLNANIKEKELEADILSINRIFKNLNLEYQKAQQNFQPEKWNPAISSLEEEIEVFLTRIQDYQASSLVSKYPGILENLRKLHENIKNLAIHYNKELHRKANLSLKETAKATETKEKSITNSHAAMQNLLKIIEQHKTKEQETKEKARQEMNKGISLLQSLYEEAQKALKIEQLQDFLSWCEEYKKKQEDLSLCLEKIESFSPGVYSSSKKILFMLQDRVEFQKKILKGQLSEEKYKIQFKETELQIALLLRSIQKELQK